MPASIACSTFICFTFLFGTVTAVTPVEKVVTLLTRLQAQIEEEGKTEAAQYDKYACFCKEQADNKLYAIEKSQDKIKALTAQISQLEADIADLNGDISELSTRITKLEGEIKTANALRAKEHEGYLTQEKDLAEGITAITDAIVALKDSKEQMSNTKLDLVQVRSLARRTLDLIDKLPHIVLPSVSQLRADLGTMIMEPAGEPAAAAGTTQKQYAAKVSYEYHSNDIIATLQGLLKTFKQNKKDLDENEFQMRAVHDKKVLGLANEKKFAEKDKAEKEEVVAQKTDDMHSAQQDKSAEADAKNADASFMDELTEACQGKAEGWDKRSKTRAAELTAIAQGIEVLKNGVAKNYGANKKLVGLETVGKVRHAAESSVKRIQTPTKSGTAVTGKLSFLQIQINNQDTVPQRVVRLLEGEAKRLKSSALASLTTQVDLAAGIDHFVKVRGLIKALVERLEADALSEADQKSFCDENMKAATDARDSAKLNMEQHKATISQTMAEKQEVLTEIQVLIEQIAELNKSLNEATQLRAAEKAGNEKTLADAGAGKDAVTLALTLLKEFYGGAALVQHGKYVPPNADRDGKTVGDLAPEIYEGEYKGKQGASGGIIGILEVILSDFERTEKVVGEEEKAAEEEFKDFEADTNADIDAKGKEKGEKETKVATLVDEIITAKDNLKDAEKAHAGSLEELEKLSSMCVAGEESWEERREKRKQEVEALKQALQILDDWKN